MKIETFVGELLYYHDCVIVPDFGGFVANYKSAYLHPAQHTFSPPAKRIAFNANLKNNDGLLANHIARKNAISYADACERIFDFTAHCNRRLSKGKKLNLENIGVLYFDHEKNLQFIPDIETNYLLDSFGLVTVHSPAIRREGYRPVKTTDLSNAGSLAGNVKRIRFRRKHILYLSAAAALAAVLFFSPVLISKMNINLSDLNPFKSNTTAVKTSVPETRSAAPLISKKETEEVNVLPNTETVDTAAAEKNTVTDTASISPTTNQPEAEKSVPLIPEKKITAEEPASTEKKAGNAEPIADVVKPPVKEKTIISKKTESADPSSGDVSNEAARYFIIVGAFKVYDNAVHFVEDLKSKGYNAAIVGLTARGLHMVSAAPAKSVYQATEQLDAVHSGEFKDAWLYRKN